jgi:tape measure domain-containing protein
MNLFELYAKLGLDSSGFDRGIQIAKAKMTSLSNNIGSGISKGISTTAARNISSGIANGIKLAERNIPTVAKSIGSVIGNGIKTNVSPNIVSGINNGLNIASRNISTVARNISSGIGNGIKTSVSTNMTNGLKLGARNLTSVLKSIDSGISKGIKTSVSTSIDSGIANGINLANKRLPSFEKSFSVTMKMIADRIPTLAKNIANGFGKGLQSGRHIINNIADGMISVGNSFTRAGSAVQSFGRGLTSIGKYASVVTAAVGGLFAKTFAKAKSYIQIYESAMVIFKNSNQIGAESAKPLFNSLMTVAKNSSYAREHIIDAGKTLVAFGFDATKTTKYVQTATNAIAKLGGTGTDIEHLTELFGKMANRGRLHGRELDEMANRGIRAWDILATHFKTDINDLRNKAKSGALSAKESLDIIIDALNETDKSSEMFKYSVEGMAKALKSGTLRGALDSLNTSFREFSINLLGMDPQSKNFESNISSLNGALASFGNFMESIGKRFSFVGDWIKNSLDKAKTALDDLSNAIYSPKDRMMNFLNDITMFGSKLPGLNEKIEQSQAPFKNIAKAILGVAAAGPGLTIAGKSVEIFGKSFGGIGKIMSGTGKVFKSFGGFKEFIKDSDKAIEKAKGFEKTVLKTFKGFSGLGKDFGNLGKSAFNATKSIGSVIGGGLSKALDVTGLGKKMQSGLLGNLAAVNMKVSPIIDGIKGKFFELGNKIPDPIRAGAVKIGSALGNIGGQVMPALGNFGGQLIQFGANLVPKLLGAFNFAAMGGAIIAGLGLLQTNFGDKIDEFAKMAMEKGPELITNFVNGITSKLPELLEKGQQLLETLLNVITTNMPVILEAAEIIIITLAQGFSQNLPMILDSALSILLMLVDTITANLPMIIQIGTEVLSNLIKGIAKHLPEIIRAGIDLIFTLCDALLDNLDELIDAGIELTIALADGLIDALPKLIEKAPILIEKLVDKIVDNLPKIIEAGIKIIIKLALGIARELPHLLGKIPGMIKKMAEGFGKLGGKLWDVGKKVIEELWNGISSMAGWIGEKISGFCNYVIGGFKSFFGISSPSKLFSNVIGKNLALGIGVGFNDTIGSVQRNMIKNFDIIGLQNSLERKVRSVALNGINVGNVSVGSSYNSRSSANMVNALISSIGRNQDSNINVYIGGKQIATEIYDPLMDLMHNKEVKIGV